MRLLPPEGPKAKRFARIAKGTVIELVAFVVLTTLGPLILVGAAVVDLILWVIKRKPWVAVRIVAFGWWFLFGELRGVTSLFVVWLLSGGPWSKDSPTRRRRTFALQVQWAAGHLAGVRVIFGLTFEVEGDELVEPGPIIAFVRHASIIDNTLPAKVISRAHGIDLRYVLKHELQMLPTLDVGARWVPTCFVKRASDDAATEIARVRTLAEGLGEHDGVLIYPEGTRHTAAKLARAQEKIMESDPSTGALAATLRHVLPPRLGGPLAILDEGAGADVVVCGHVGLDGFEYISDIWSGALVGQTVRVRFWRHPAATVPTTREERIAFVYRCWQDLDDWIDEQRALGGAVGRKARVPAA